ncbi:MAG: hypothetical protein ACFCUN_10575 [Hyphomicrobiaceae bacterium]
MTYSCFLGAEVSPELAARLGGGLRFACVEMLSRLKGHRACVVRKRDVSGPCIGDPFDVAAALHKLVAGQHNDAASDRQSRIEGQERHELRDMPQPASEARTATQGRELEAAAAANGDQAVADENTPPGRTTPTEPPRTVVEMAERAAEATGRQIEKTGETARHVGDAVGRFFTKSTTCVLSLFSNCD